MPDGDQAKSPYQLLLAAMEERQRVGIGTVVMRNKQYLTAIRPLDSVLAMSTMRFADEVVPRDEIDDMPARRAKPDAKTLKMATQLLDAMASDWKPTALPRHLHRGAAVAHRGARGKGKEIVEEEPTEPTSGKVVDLMAALEESVAKAKRGGRRRRPARKKSA